MLVRLRVKNILSYGAESEICFIPYKRLRSHLNHIAERGERPLDLLRYTAIYGANGAGKSNLLHALDLCIEALRSCQVDNLWRNRNLLIPKEEPQEIQIEFAPQGDSFTYTYGLSLREGIVEEEYLSKQGFRKDGKPSDRGEQTLLDRKREDAVYRYEIPAFDQMTNGEVYQSDVIPNLVKPNEISLGHIAKLDKEELSDIQNAYEWLTKKIQIITPNTYNTVWTVKLRNDDKFRKFYNTLISKFDTGITQLETVDLPLDKAVPPDFLSTIKEKLDKSPVYAFRSSANKVPSTFVKNSEGEIVSLFVLSEHKASDDNTPGVPFDFNMESDGTLRLVDILAIVYEMLEMDTVFLVDEIESSLHPLLIKKVLEWLMSRDDVKGQLIFTTHNPILLSSDLLRRDEIWFVEKRGADAKLYSLSDYCQEHKSIDIAKGYLSGRYGAIPFLGELDGLKWR